MSEIELKLIIDEATSRSIWARVRSLGYLDRRPRARTLKSLCFDSRDRALYKAGIALQLNKRGRYWTQSVQCCGDVSDSRIGRPQAVESRVPGTEVVLDRITDDGLRDDIAGRLKGESPVAVCELSIKRATAAILVNHGTRVEVRVDNGDIVAGQQVAALREVRIALIEGDAADLFTLAKALFPSGGVRFSRYSKVARGYMLASCGDIEPPLAPRNAKIVDLRKSETVERAARDMLRECRAQVATNVGVILETIDPEGPHQLRVGLRRLRSVLSVFKPVLSSTEATRLRAEAQWLGAEVGRLRDVDAVTADVVRPEAARFAEESGFSPLIDALEAEAARRRDGLREILRGERVQSFIFDLVRFIEARGWIVGSDIEQTERLAMPVSQFADEALCRRWRKVVKRGRKLESLTIEARHELRKELKKLRYLTEFFAPLYPGKRVSPFLKSLKKLQLIFGEFNDAQVARRVLNELPSPHASTERAAGCVIGASQTRAAIDWGRAGVLWKDLRKTEPFWR